MPRPGATPSRPCAPATPGPRPGATPPHRGSRSTPPGARGAAADTPLPAPERTARAAGLRRGRAIRRWSSSLQQVEVVRHHGAADPEEKNDDGQAERGLSYCDADGEDRENHSRDIAAESRERDQVDVDRVQHQLDAQQDADGVATGDDAEEANAEDD